MLPVWNGIICFQSAIISTNALGLVVLDPPLCTMLLGHSHSVHRQFHAAGEELGNLGLSRKANTCWHRLVLSHLLEILLHWHISTEVEVVLQAIAIDIPHTVEIAGSEPIGVEDFLWSGASDSIQQEALKLVVRDTVVLSRTDIIVVLPEILGYLIAAHALQQSSAIFHRSPLQHASDRHVEHDRIVVLQYGRVEDTRLAETDPLLDRRIGNDTLCFGFGQTVVVVC